MRIPRGFEHKSPQSSARYKVAPPSPEPDKNIGVRKTTRGGKHHTVQSKSQKQKSSSVASQTGQILDLYATLPSMSEVSPISNVQEDTETARVRQEPPAVGLRLVSNVANFRPQICHKTSSSNVQSSLSPIAENSNEDSGNVREYTADMKVAVQRTDAVLHEKKTHQVQRSEQQSTVMQEYTGRRDVSGLTLSKGMIECRPGDNSDVRRLATSGSNQQSSVAVEVYKHASQRNEGQGEPCTSRAETLQVCVKDGRVPASRNLCDKGIVIEDHQNIRAQKSLNQDVATQIPLLDIDKQLSPVSLAQLVTVSTKCSSTSVVEQTTNIELCHTHTCALQPLLADRKLTDETFCIQRSRINAQSRIHDTWEVRSDDRLLSVDGSANRIVTFMPSYEKLQQQQLLESPIMKRSYANMKLAMPLSQLHGYTEQSTSRQHEAKNNSKLQNDVSLPTDTCLLGDDSTMPPPPFGYHVRRDFSNPDSSTDFFRKINVSAGDNINGSTMQGMDDICNNIKSVSPIGTDSSNGNSEPLKAMLRKHRIQTKDYNSRFGDCMGCSVYNHNAAGHDERPDGSVYSNKAMRPKKLVILGKLNNVLGGHKRHGKHEIKNKFILSREHKNDVFNTNHKSKEKVGHRSARIAWAYPKFGDDSALVTAEKLSPHGKLKPAKSAVDPVNMGSMEGGIKCYYKIVSNSHQNIPDVYLKTNARNKSSWKRNSHACLKGIDLKSNLAYAKSLHRTIKAAGCQPSMEKSQETNHKSPDYRSSNKHTDRFPQRGIISSRDMNVNSNAGIAEGCAANIVGEVPQTADVSGQSSNHQSSTSAHTETNSDESDVKISPSISLTLEVEDTNTEERSETSLNICRNSEQVRANTQEKEEKSLIDCPQVSTAYVFDTLQTKAPEHIRSENALNIIRDENHVHQSLDAIEVTNRQYGTSLTNKRNKKNKSAEAAGVTCDSITSKTMKGSATVADIRRSLLNKQRTERPRQFLRVTDAQKAVSVVPEKLNKILADSPRLIKIGKYSEGHHDILETRLKQKLGHDVALEYELVKESHREGITSNNTSNQGVRSGDSTHRYNPLKNVMSPCWRSQETSQVKRLVSLPKTMSSDEYLKNTYMSPSKHTARSDVADTKSNNESMSVGVFKRSTHSQEWRHQELSTDTSKTETIAILYQTNQSESLQKDMIESPKMQLNTCSPNIEFSHSPKIEFKYSPKIDFQCSSKIEIISPKFDFRSSPKIELSSPKIGFTSPMFDFSRPPRMDLSAPLQEQSVIYEKTSPAENASTDNKMDKTEELDSQLLKEIKKRKPLEFVNVSQKFEPTDCNMRENIRRRSLDNDFMQRVSRKHLPGEITADEEGIAKDPRSHSTNLRECHHMTSVKKKKLVPCSKSQSRSHEGKKKKQLVGKCSTNSDSKSKSLKSEPSKSEKTKKLKHADKVVEKKKKKKKDRDKTPDVMKENLRNDKSTKNTHTLRSVSTESRKALRRETRCSLSASKCAHVATPDTNTPADHITKDGEDMSTALRYKPPVREEADHSLDTQQVWKSEPVMNEGCTMVMPADYTRTSEANISQQDMVSPKECVPPALKAPAKLNQISSSFPKTKKNDRDLQEAELGWNSSTFSIELKTTTDKSKQCQKRTKVRYYLVKSKQNREKEVVASKLKRPAARFDHRDVLCCSSDINFSPDAVSQERCKSGVGKSVQFSDQIEDLEASQEGAESEMTTWKHENRNMVHEVVHKTAVDISQPVNKMIDIEVSVMGKPISQKKEEQKLQITPPRRKRPVWTKKSTDRRIENKVNAAGKTVAAVLPVQHHTSSDNIVKMPSRFNVHVFYPVKSSGSSPKSGKLNQNDIRNVAYNTSVNGLFLATPINKTNKKILAKTGSPVDIKEIIEGSSVDAVDHFKGKKSSSDGSVRAARSVPSLAPYREVIAGKKMKASDDSRLVTYKKCKDLKNWSPRSLSVQDTKEDNIIAAKVGPDVSNLLPSPEYPTNLDNVMRLKKRSVLGRFIDQSNTIRKGKKMAKTISHDGAAKWQLVATKETGGVADLTQVRYCGDIMELNVLNMGLAWVVQSVVSRLPFLNNRQADPTVTSSRDLTSDQQVVE